MNLRQRLTTFTVLFLAFSLLVIGSGLYAYERAILLNGVQEDLFRATERFQTQYRDTKAPLEGLIDSSEIGPLLRLPAEEFEGSPISVAVYKSSGVIIDSSQTFMSNESLKLRPADLRSALDGKTVVAEVPLRQNRLLQVVSPLTFDNKVVGVLVISQSLRTIDRALNSLIVVLLVSGVIMLLTALFGVNFIVGRALRPISQISVTAEQIVRAEDLSRRVTISNPQDELGRLGTIINDLLARLEVLFNTQRRLTADVSHELRTPLAAMRGNIEVLRRGAFNNPELLSESL